jgi:hypothetical protein
VNDVHTNELIDLRNLLDSPEEVDQLRRAYMKCKCKGFVSLHCSSVIRE